MAADCNYTLKKLMGLFESTLSETLRLLIISMPPETTCMDFYYAKRLCQLYYQSGSDLQIIFIRHEDKQEFISRVFERQKKKFTQLTTVNLSLSLSEGT